MTSYPERLRHILEGAHQELHVLVMQHPNQTIILWRSIDYDEDPDYYEVNQNALYELPCHTPFGDNGHCWTEYIIKVRKVGNSLVMVTHDNEEGSEQERYWSELSFNEQAYLADYLLQYHKPTI